MVAPSVKNLAQTYKDKMKVVKFNVDENPKTPANYGILSIPTLLLFKGGELKETIIGAIPQNRIEDAITKHL
jgi:thioredoxin 1